ncbi:sulfotransferase [Stakelama sp. CBK3Z-3]|uniref:Sulfotransferase n=1 Tax=Stakelama flava TaxID=2860338 RepID=A0ABS6XL72_9SPHN|nr:sulfotransferase [Stakelama flava]MBW4330165.1 sulfotransferase [Stakelama flava]
MPRKLARSALLDQPGLCFDAQAARRELGCDARNRPVAICEENLSGYIHNAGLHGLMGPEVARRLHAVFPDARIVVFIRNQVDLLRATYAQYVAGGGTHGPRRYLFPTEHRRGALRYRYKAPGFCFSHFEFDRLIAYYDSLFGRENVHVYLYEELRSDRAGLLARMERELGVEFDLQAAPAGRRNASMGRTSLWLLRGVNLFTRQSVVDKTVAIDIPGWTAMRHAVKAVLPSGRPGQCPGAILGHDTVAYARARYAASNARLARLRDLPLARHGYCLVPPGKEGS